MGIDPYILSDPAFYKAVEEAFKGNIPGGEAVEASIQNAIKALVVDDVDVSVLFGCSRIQHSGGLPSTEAMWGDFQAFGLDDAIRIPTPFRGRFQDMAVNVTTNTLVGTLDVSLKVDGLGIGIQEHIISYAAGETGLKFLATPTVDDIPVASDISFSFFPAAPGVVGIFRGSASIRLKKNP